MRRTVAKKLKKEATANHPYKKLKKEYKAMKAAVGDPKPKEEKRGGQELAIVRERLFKKGRHVKNVYHIVDKNKFKSGNIPKKSNI